MVCNLIQQGNNYWRFSDMTRDPGYPKQIAKGFAGIPNNVDAAFVWSGNGKIYFFKVSCSLSVFLYLRICLRDSSMKAKGGRVIK